MQDWYLADNYEPCPSIKRNLEQRKSVKNLCNAEWHLGKQDYRKKYRRERSKTDVLFKFKASLRCNILSSFKRRGFKKGGRTFDVLGCDYDIFIKHITDKFTEGMTLENHGEWHLDHQIPLKYAETEDEVVELCHYTNYQPLWAKDNLGKSSKVNLKNISFTNKVKYIKFLNRI
jgi:hypothetical protein